MPPRSTTWPWLLAIPALLLVNGCLTVGPDYQPPPTATPEAWRTPLRDGLNATPPAADSLATWWRALHDPLLDQLIQEALRDGTDLKLAAAKLREVRARRGVSFSTLFPSVDATGAASRGQLSENGLGNGHSDTHTLYATGFDAAWELDLFGGRRRALEAANADVRAGEANLRDVQVTLAAETALNYMEARTYQLRLQVAQNNLAAQQETFALIQSLFTAGLSNELALHQARYNVENTRSVIPNLLTGFEASANRLAILTGQLPGGVQQRLTPLAPTPALPAEFAVGVPAEMLRRRPDIRRAEEELIAQTARIGEAKADYYPKLHLFGAIGLESFDSGTLLDANSRTWSVGPGMRWPIFNAGRVRSTIEIRSAQQEQALLRYENSVRQAVAEVENALTAYANEQARCQALAAAGEAAQKAEALAQEQYRAGLVDFSNVLDAQRSLFSFQNQLALSRGIAIANMIALYKALGGGWEPLP